MVPVSTLTDGDGTEQCDSTEDKLLGGGLHSLSPRGLPWLCLGAGCLSAGCMQVHSQATGVLPVDPSPADPSPADPLACGPTSQRSKQQ